MPCYICNYYFKYKPCDSNKPIVIISEDKNIEHSVKLLTRKYILMNDHCPCKNCLVKIMCSEICMPFHSMISKEEPVKEKYNYAL